MMKYLVHIALFFTSLNALQAGIITVAQDGSGDVTSVQEGIDLTQTSDTILVMPGTYYENLLIEGKALTLASNYIFSNDTDDIANTIIDGNNMSQVLIVNEAANVFVHGLTIQNGRSSSLAESIYMQACTSKDNSTLFSKGAGINAINSSGGICNCIIKDNNSNTGAGILLQVQSHFRLEKCTIKNNHAYEYGGGIYADSESSFILDSLNRCNIYLNTAGRIASDIYFRQNMTGSALYLDTGTVVNPSRHYINCTDNYFTHIPDYEVDVLEGKISQVTLDLYVNPQTGSNSNQGTTPEAPLENLWFALLKMKSDQRPPLTIHLADGEYSVTANNERFPSFVKEGINVAGASCESTIINTENICEAFTYSYLHGYNELRNLTLLNGGEILNGIKGQISIDKTNSILIENVVIDNYESPTNCGIDANMVDTVCIRNSTVKNGKGAYGISIQGSDTYIMLESIGIHNIKPHTVPVPPGTGGAVFIQGITSDNTVNADIINCEITENTSGETFLLHASGLYLKGSTSVRLINSTLSNNESPINAAITLVGSSNLEIINSIVYNNPDNEILLNYAEAAPSLEVSYSDIKGGEYNIEIQGSANVYWNEGNIDIDPVFTTYNGTDYFLADNSSCINTGTMDIDDFTFPEYDLMGNLRLHGIVDMGAYENPFVPVSISNHRSEETTVSPNPGNDRIILTINKNDFTFRLYDQTGKEVLQSSGKKTISTSALPQGMYYYRITCDQQILSSGKWVKQ